MTGGVPLEVLVRKTAVPGTRGILRDSIDPMNSSDRNEPLVENLCDRRRPAMPNQHDAIDKAGQKQRYISAVGDLHEIREEEADINEEEGAGDRTAREQAPSPDLAHGDEQERRGHKHGRGNSDAVGGGQIVGLAEEQTSGRP